MLRCQLSTREVEVLHQAGAAVSFPLETPAVRRPLQARDESLPRHRRGVTDPQSLEARHDLSCAAPAHTEELLDRRAVELSGCHGPQGGENFFKSMKAGGLRGHGGTPALLHVRERSGIMACRGAAGEGVYHE